MKKTLLSLSLLTVALMGKAQNCSDLIISEYVEGSGNNKAIEFYNTSSTPINLANYRLIRWDNGSTTSDQTSEGVMQLPTNITLAPYQTYVIALNLTDPSGTGQSAPISTALQAKADTLLCPGCATGTGLPRVMCFNGDDALELQKTTNGGGSWSTVDLFACKGERPSNSSGSFSPGAGWTIISPFSSIPSNYSANYPGVPYFKQYWTQDKTLNRKATVKTGVTVNPAFETFNASVQWDSTSVDNFTGLGAHTCDCNLVGIKEMSKTFEVSVFPNPSKGMIQLHSSNFITKMTITSVTGQIVKTVKSNSNLSGVAVNVSDLVHGIYFVTMMDDKNNQSVKKLIIE